MLDERGTHSAQSEDHSRAFVTRIYRAHITEDTSDAPICHRFTLTDPMNYQQYRLKVGWRRLSDRTSTPERTRDSLVHGDVAY